jgi:tetratricopeptide (TPR) repeat protein
MGRQIRVFISSTFRDMQAERDYLIKFTFPQLRRLCESRGVTWGEVDLRWGVTDEEAAEGKVLPICLEEIRRCQPYFIGLLGERYGWVPQHIPDNLIAQQPWLEQHRQRSVTELEIIHGVLRNAEMHQHACFYFRDPAFVAGMPDEKKTDFTSENADFAVKLQQLKNDIRHARDEQICQLRESFKTPEELGEWVLEDFTRMIEETWSEDLRPEPLDREAADHEVSAQSRTRVYMGRQEYFDRLDAHAAANSTTPLVVLGEPGSGKSALLANWVARYREAHPDTFVLQHYIGATPQSTDGAALLRRLVGEFKRRFGIQQDIPNRPDALRSAFPNWLYVAGTKGRLVLVLDGLDQLEDRDGAPHLVWLPSVLPGNVRIIVSTLPGRSMDEIQKRNWPTLKVESLTERERMKLLWRFLRQSGKRLSKERRRRIATAPQAANPLYLRVLLNELRLFGENERLEERIGYYLQANLPHELYGKVIGHWEKVYGSDLVRNAFSLLWAARQGLSESELLEALGSGNKPLPHAPWSALYLAADHALVDRSGLIGLAHDHLRRAIDAKWLNCAKARRATHLALASYFTSKRRGTMRALDEVPWQLMRAEEWKELRDFLVDSESLRKLWERDVRMVRRCWHEVESNSLFRLADSYYGLLDQPPTEATFLSQIVAANLLRDFSHSELVLSWCRKARSSMGPQDRSNRKLLDKLEVSILQDRGEFKTVVPLLGDLISIATGDDNVLLTISLFERGSALNSLGQYDEGLQDLIRAEKLAQEIGDIRLTAKVALERGHAAMHLGNLETAEEQFRSAETASRAGRDNVTLASALDSLGSIRMVMGDSEKALRMFDEEAAICRECSDSIGLARALTARGIAMGKMPLTEPAVVLPLFDEAERICRETSNQMGQACAVGGRGRYLRRLGRYNEALACQVLEMAIWEKLNTPQYLASCLLEQCATHYAMRNLDEAKRCLGAANALLDPFGAPHQHEVSQVAETLLGAQFALPVRQTLPSAYASPAEAEEAEQRLLHAIEEDSRLNGECSASVWRHRLELGNLLLMTGRSSEAVPQLDKALTIAREVFGDRSNTSANLNLLADAQIQLGRYDEAKSLLEEALELDRKTGPKWSEERAQTLSHLGLLMWRQGHLVEAEKYYRQALQMLELILPSEHEALSIPLSSLGCVLDDLGKKEESERLHRWALANDLKAFGSDHPRLATRNHNLGCLLRSMGRLAEARDCFIRTLEIDRRIKGIRSRETAADLVTIAEISAAIDDYRDAAERIAEAIMALQGMEALERDLCYKLFMLSGQVHKQLPLAEAHSLVGKALASAQTAFADDSSETGQMLRRMVLTSETPADGKEGGRETSQRPAASDSDTPAILAELNQAQVELPSFEEGENLLARGLRLRKRIQGRQREALTELMNRLAIHMLGSHHSGDEPCEAPAGLVSNDRNLQAAAASAWIELAERATTRGDWELATEAADNSLELFRTLYNASDAKPNWLCDHAGALMLKGDLDFQRDHLGSAKLAFEQAKAKYGELLKLEPQKALFQRGLGVSCDKLGDIAKADDDLGTAGEAYRQALSLFRQAARVDPDFLRDLSLCLAKLGESELAREDVSEARRALQEHFALATRIANADVTNMEHQLDLAGAHGRMAQLAGSTGDVRDALKHLEAAHGIIEAVAAFDRSNIRWQQDLAGSLFNLGMLLAQTGDIARGARMANQSYSMLKEMDDADRLDARGRSLLRHLHSMVRRNE